MATTELLCARHGTPTHLACAQCDQPACTKCLVWTEVGQKCRTCVYPKGDPNRTAIPKPALLAVALALVLVVGVLGGLGVLSKDSPPKVPVAGNTGRTQPGIGQPARVGMLTFVVTKFDCEAGELSNGPLKRTALGRFCVLQFKATNTGNRPTAFGFSDVALLDSQDRRFAPDTLATAFLQGTRSSPSPIGPRESPIGPREQLNPGTEIASSVVYDVPQGVTPELAEFRAARSLGVTVRLTEPGRPV